MTSDSSYSDAEEETQSTNQNYSIDHSLNAIENQLSSITLNETPSVADDDDDHHDVPVMEIANGCSSPSSSGYAGGSNGATSASGADNDDIHQHRNNTLTDCEDELLDSARSQWVPGKRHAHEDDASMSWRERKKHFFVVTLENQYFQATVGLTSRFGDEHKLAGFSATLQAIISFVEDGGDRVKLVRAGKHQVVFLVKGPIYLACISCTEEPYESLQGQLELLYGQMLLILNKSVNRCFEKNPKFDMTPLLGGTDAVFSSLFHSFSWQTAGAVLQDVADSGILFAMLMCKHKVHRKYHSILMICCCLLTYVMSSESFRTSESFSPICLPRYNPMAFLHAYVHYLDVDTYLVLLTSSSDAFFHLKDYRILVEKVLLKSNVLTEVQRSLLKGGMRVEDLPVYPSSRSASLFHLNETILATRPQEGLQESVLGIGGLAGLWHFIYRNMYLDQYVSSEFTSPISGHRQQKRLYRAYQKVYASMHDKGTGPHKTQFKRDVNYVLLCWVTQDFELYAAFDPLADKWVKDVENEIFLLGGSPFAW